MDIGIISLFPEMFRAISDCGITRRAIENQHVRLHHFNPRDDAPLPHQRVDDRPYGGGPGMVMQVAPLQAALGRAKNQLGDKTPVIALSPQGQLLSQSVLQQLSSQPKLVFVCGRYEGIDERFMDFVDLELSLGDYILSGGELGAMVIIDGIIRLLPGALGDAQSALQDSFSEGLLDHPHYTRPEIINEQVVPSVLLSGDHQAINRWRSQQALGRTWLKRPDLLEKMTLSAEQQLLLDEFIKEHMGSS